MIKAFLCAGLLAMGSTAFAEEAVIPIVVKQRTQQAPKAAPFASVGLFEIYRGETKFTGASCPDLSNKDGHLSCTITCSEKERTSKNLRIVPPGKSIQVRGFVTPPAGEIELVGCKLNPDLVQEFVYTDSRLALFILFQADPTLSRFAIVGKDGKTVTFGDWPAVLEAYDKVLKSPDGVAKLSHIQKISAVAADANQAGGNVDAAKLFNAYSVGVSNYFLKTISVTNIGADSKSIKLTGTTPDYYQNLRLVETGLEKQMGRTPVQNQLLNDVQKLRNSPYTLKDQGILKDHAMEAIKTSP
jgi:hypothetical protein